MKYLLIITFASICTLLTFSIMASLVSVNSSGLSELEIKNFWASKKSTEIEYELPKYQKGRVISCYGNGFTSEFITESLFKSNLVPPLETKVNLNNIGLPNLIGVLVNPLSCELKNKNCVEIDI